MGRDALFWGAALVISATSSAPARDIPVLSGRWSSAGCLHASPATTRFFGTGTTSSDNDKCTVTVVTAADNVFHAHLTCRYRAAQPAEDDVVLKVNSPTSLDWIDACTATPYRFCAKGAPP